MQFSPARRGHICQTAWRHEWRLGHGLAPIYAHETAGCARFGYFVYLHSTTDGVDAIRVDGTRHFALRPARRLEKVGPPPAHGALEPDDLVVFPNPGIDQLVDGSRTGVYGGIRGSRDPGYISGMELYGNKL